MKLGNYIKQYRDEHNLSQRAFAELCGVSNGYISLIERDEIDKRTGKPSKPKIDSLMAIAKGMGLTLQELVDAVDVDIPVDLDTIKVKTPTHVIEDERAVSTGVPDITLGQKIKALRTKHNLTLEQLGNAVGVGKSTVRKWENGIIANMRVDKLSHLAKVLQTTPSYLMGWECEKLTVITYDELSAISGLFAELSTDNRAKLLELAHLFLDAQRKK